MTGLIADTEGSPGKLVKEGGGTLVRNGSAANIYTGGTQVKGGTLSIARADIGKGDQPPPRNNTGQGAEGAARYRSLSLS